MFDEEYEPYIEKRRERRIKDRNRLQKRTEKRLARQWSRFRPGYSRWRDIRGIPWTQKEMERHPTLAVTAARYRDTPKPHKCVCCGNPRRYLKGRTKTELTRQERLAMLGDKDWN